MYVLYGIESQTMEGGLTINAVFFGTIGLVKKIKKK